MRFHTSQYLNIYRWQRSSSINRRFLLRDLTCIRYLYLHPMYNWIHCSSRFSVTFQRVSLITLLELVTMIKISTTDQMVTMFHPHLEKIRRRLCLADLPTCWNVLVLINDDRIGCQRQKFPKPRRKSQVCKDHSVGSICGWLFSVSGIYKVSQSLWIPLAYYVWKVATLNTIIVCQPSVTSCSWLSATLVR